MSENSYLSRSEKPLYYVEPRARSLGTSGPKFEFKVDVNKISRGRYIISVTRVNPPNTKVKVIYSKDKKEVEDATIELKERLSKGNI